MDSLIAFTEFRAKLDTVLASAWNQYGSQMQCKAGCFGCCKNNFRISWIEAYELQQAFDQLPSTLQQQVANQLAQEDGQLCPLLIEGECSLYDDRPILCRVFGFPISDGETIATCELNFTQDRDGLETYQCFDSRTIAQSLHALNRLFLSELGTPLPKDQDPLPAVTISQVLQQFLLGQEHGPPKTC